MSRNALIAIVVIVGLFIIGGVALALGGGDPEPVTTNESTTINNTESTTPATDQPPAANQEASANAIQIDGYTFDPAKLTVKKGTTVTWTNMDSVQHDITPDTPTDEFKASEMLKKNETYSVTFNTVGTYTYHCSPHPYMKGTIEVTE
jgi:amicyanin